MSVKTSDLVADSVDLGGFQDGENAKVEVKSTNPIKADDKLVLNGKTYEFVSDASQKVSDGAIGVESRKG